MDIRRGPVAGLNNPASIAVTGGSISGVTGAPMLLSASGIPFIALSSGSVAANGAISAITALPAIYPSAYCWFPANILATVKAAGWYYCTFSSTTAGVAFLDTYTSGIPAIPASPTAVVDGKGVFVAATTELFATTLTVPVMGVASAIRILASAMATNNANAKSVSVRCSGSAGTVFFTQSLASLAGAGFAGLISNTGVATKQISQVISSFGGSPSVANVLGTVDLSAGTATLVFTLTHGTVTDNLVFLPPTVEIVQ